MRSNHPFKLVATIGRNEEPAVRGDKPIKRASLEGGFGATTTCLGCAAAMQLLYRHLRLAKSVMSDASDTAK